MNVSIERLQLLASVWSRSITTVLRPPGSEAPEALWRSNADHGVALLLMEGCMVAKQNRASLQKTWLGLGLGLGLELGLGLGLVMAVADQVAIVAVSVSDDLVDLNMVTRPVANNFQL